MSDGEQSDTAACVEEFVDTVLQHPDCAVIWAVISPERDGAVVRALGGAADLGLALEGIGEVLDQVHTYGKCNNCDRTALAIRAALDAYRAALGGPRTASCN